LEPAVALWFTAAFSDLGARLLLGFCAVLGGTLAFDIDWLKIADAIGRAMPEPVAHIVELGGMTSKIDASCEKKKTKRSVQIAAHVQKEKHRTPPKIKPPSLLEAPGRKAEREKQQPLFELGDLMPMPPLDLLDPPTSSGPRGYSNSELESLSRLP
jgi:S-DNA-T family DNA segregation ATPase FtsK/SpoIIIE